VLVSGRPISFQMDLYQPLYVPRPMVEPELFASLRPPTYNSAMGDRDEARRPAAATPPPMAMPMATAGAMPADAQLGLKDAGKAGFGAGGLLKKMDEKMDLGQGVQSAATASQLGDFFQYTLDKPVSLARQKSALLPIVNKEVQGERVSIYNQATHAKFPLLGLKFKNTTGLHLNQGPVTVFEGASYAGDARVLDVQPNEERLISFAVDLGTEVEPVVENPRHTLTKVKVVKGVLHSTTRVIESKTYKVTNRSTTDRTLLIEHPFRGDFKLTSKEEPVERARDVYRFQLKVPAGKSASQTVTEERDNVAQVVLTNGDDNTIRVFIQSNVTSKAAQEALKKALELKGKADLTNQALAHQNQQLADIERDQARIRQNLKETPPTAEAYKKYLTKLDSQETEIDKLREQIKKLQADQLQQRKDYEGYLANLDVE
jgi:hypothetical protein